MALWKLGTGEEAWNGGCSTSYQHYAEGSSRPLIKTYLAGRECSNAGGPAGREAEAPVAAHSQRRLAGRPG